MVIRDEDFGADPTLTEGDDEIWSPSGSALPCEARDLRSLYEQEHARAERERARAGAAEAREQDPGDGSLIRAALNDIARAHSVTELARETGMTRVGIYKALAPDGNPTFATLMRITRALGLQVRITA